MSDTLSIRLPADEKARLQRAAREAGETAAEYVRVALRQRMNSNAKARLARFHRSVKCQLPPRIDNAAIRRAMGGRR